VSATLHEAELLRVRLPFVTPFRNAHNTMTVKEALLVRVQTSDGVGWGECTAPATPEYDGETIDGARLALREHLLPRAFADQPFDDVRGHAAARAALECALLDAHLRARGIALAAWLGAERTHVDAGVAVGMVDDPGVLRRTVAAYVDDGYRRIKCKIEPGADVDTLALVRAEVGPDVELAADANGSYGLDDARALLAAVEPLGLQCVEQPCAPDAIAEHALLAGATATPVCLDESVTSDTVAADLVARGAADVLALKVGRLGIRGARRAHDVCVRSRTGALAGGMLETGIGRAALLAIAALPGFTFTGDVSASARYFGPDGDITEPFVLDLGRLRVPVGAGLGVTPRPDRLARCTVARERLTGRD
jgi:o-succinylbenzoate synthase